MPPRFPALLFFLLAAGTAVQADITLPAILSDHAVLQKSARTRLWGKADPGEQVAVTLGDAAAKTVAGADGKWAVQLDLSQSKSGPFELVAQGKNRVAVADVLVGEVWIASGQSNMAFSMGEDLYAKEELPASANPQLRQFTVFRKVAGQPLDDCAGQWISADPKNTARFTAVGYYFGKRLQNELKTPVGLVNASWGGTVVEGWTSAEAIDSVPELNAARQRTLQAYEAYPAAKEAYIAQFGQWLQTSGREDRPCSDPAAYAAPGLSTEGWTQVTLPGSLQSQGLPAAGAIWLRREIEIPAAKAGKPFRVEWGPQPGFESVYWNGQPVSAFTHRDIQGRDQFRAPAVPGDQVKEGVNLLAVRIYAPAGLPPSLDRFQPLLRGGWWAKTEYTLPPLDAAQDAQVPQPPLRRPSPEDLPGSIFNAMIAPVVPHTIRGVIWYQGEFNSSRAWQYRVAFPLLINDWRTRWGQGDFPFYFCQLPMFQGKFSQPGESSWAELRESQLKTLSVPHTGMAVLIDTGEAGEIHPREKRPAGERLAALALANDYGREIPHRSPLYERMSVEGNKIRLHFRHAEGGLAARPLPETYIVKSVENLTAPLVRHSPQSELEGFAICGADNQWVWADAKIDGGTVLVWSDRVAKPVAVRYAWATNPTGNLYNGAGFPASPFRTDDFTLSTQNIR